MRLETTYGRRVRTSDRFLKGWECVSLIFPFLEISARSDTPAKVNMQKCLWVWLEIQVELNGLLCFIERRAWQLQDRPRGQGRGPQKRMWSITPYSLRWAAHSGIFPKRTAQEKGNEKSLHGKKMWQTQPQPGGQGQHQQWSVMLTACFLDELWGEGHSISVLFFP